MNPFRYERARDAESAVALLAQAPNGAFLGGGTNLVDHMKLEVRQPDLLVDITRLPYDHIELLPNGHVRIGAMVRNSDLAADRTIRTRYPLLAQALLPCPEGTQVGGLCYKNYEEKNGAWVVISIFFRRPLQTPRRPAQPGL